MEHIEETVEQARETPLEPIPEGSAQGHTSSLNESDQAEAEEPPKAAIRDTIRDTPPSPKKKPRKLIEKIPCPKCGKKYSKQVLQYRTHKCEVPVFPDDDGDDRDSCVVPPAAEPAPPRDTAPPEPFPEAAPVNAPSRENVSILIKQERDERRAAKRRMIASHMF